MQPFRIIRFRSCAVTVLLAAVFFCIGSRPAIQAQTQEATSTATPSFLRYGLFGGVVVNNHSPNFTDFADYSIEPSPLQSSFGSTSVALSYYVGGFIELPVAQRFGIALRASITNVGGFMLVGKENLLVGTVSGGNFALEISHLLSISSLQMLSGEPYLTYRILDGLTLYAGARFGYMINPSYSYKQKIPDDSPGRFSNWSGTEYAVRSGNIPQINSLNCALSFGVSIEIPIDPSNHWFLAAEGFYMHGLTQVANGLILRRPVATFNGLSATRTVQQNELGTDKDPLSTAWPSEIVAGSWLFNNLRAGISLRYAP